MPEERKTLAWHCEEMVRLIMVDDSRFPAFDIRHHAKDVAGAIETITLKGEEHDARPDGPPGGCQDVIVQATMATIKKMEESEPLALAMIECMYVPNPAILSMLEETFPIYAWLEPEMRHSRQDGRKIRKHIVTFPLIAKFR